MRVLIVDDEFHARKLLIDYVSKLPFLELADAVPNVFEAMGVLQNNPVEYCYWIYKCRKLPDWSLHEA